MRFEAVRSCVLPERVARVKVLLPPVLVSSVRTRSAARSPLDAFTIGPRIERAGL